MASAAISNNSIICGSQEAKISLNRCYSINCVCCSSYTTAIRQ